MQYSEAQTDDKVLVVTQESEISWLYTGQQVTVVIDETPVVS